MNADLEWCLKTHTMNTCPECTYLREERAAIHHHDGGATKEDAERMAADTRCHEHEPKMEQVELI